MKDRQVKWLAVAATVVFAAWAGAALVAELVGAYW